MDAPIKAFALLMVATPQASPTIGTQIFLVHQLGLWRQTFRIMAPLASQRAALQKYRDPGTGAVMDGKLFDIKNRSFYHTLYCWRLSTWF
jgi:hypothetical protein